MLSARHWIAIPIQSFTIRGLEFFSLGQRKGLILREFLRQRS